MSYPDLKSLRAAYERGENITQLLRQYGVDSQTNETEAIELAYELQAGSYSRNALSDLPGYLTRSEELGRFLQSHLSCFDIMLDCGSGELTTLCGVSPYLPASLKLMAFDLSISRLNAGRRFATRFLRNDLLAGLELFVASMEHIPLPVDAVDVVTTFHALEANHGRESLLIRELLRVGRRKLLLFEPSFEDNSPEGCERMIALGYVRDLPAHIQAAGGRLVEKVLLDYQFNPLNPTACYVVEKVPDTAAELRDTQYLCPLTGEPLQRFSDYFWSPAGYAYPTINGIPLLRKKDAILMCHP